ncbi:MAG: universal stress protein [Rhodospirillales bacterium]|nr:universal stress protein [Rhodospirillales bacterium]
MTDTSGSTENKTNTEHEHQGPVLCAVDFSGDSRAAVRWAKRNAACLKTSLLVLHIIHDPLDAPGYYKQAEGENLRPMEDVAEAMMREFVLDELGLDLDKDETGEVQTKLMLGVPVPRILEVAEKVDAQIIVMGSQGRTGLKYLLLGSKAEQVVRLSPVPVTIVKEAKQKE